MLLRKRRCADFLRQADGSVAIMFALASVVLVLAVGLAVDYGQVSLAQTRLQADADSATLSAISLQLSPGANAALQASTLQQNALASFNALAAGDNIQIASATATASSAPNPPSVTLSYSGSVPAVFGQLAGLQTYSAQGTSGATAGATGGAPAQPKFIDIYFLVKIGGSMGVGATPTDQLLMNQTFNCNLACHDNGTDTVAHQAGATLRIDVVKSAIQQVLSAAQALGTSGPTVRFALFSYANDAVTVAPITSSLNAIGNAVTNLQLAGDHAGTATYNALQYIASQISAVGDGSTATNPLVYVILATNGTDDSFDNGGNNMTGNPSISANFYPPYSAALVGPPFPHDVPDTSSPLFELEGVDPAWCQPLKTMGVNVMTLEMPYVVPTQAVIPSPSTVAVPYPGMLSNMNDEITDLRMTYIQNTLLPIIPGQLTACASQPSYHISANSPSDIMAAMASLFSLTQQPPLATQTVPRLIQ